MNIQNNNNLVKLLGEENYNKIIKNKENILNEIIKFDNELIEDKTEENLDIIYIKYNDSGERVKDIKDSLKIQLDIVNGYLEDIKDNSNYGDNIKYIVYYAQILNSIAEVFNTIESRLTPMIYLDTISKKIGETSTIYHKTLANKIPLIIKELSNNIEAIENSKSYRILNETTITNNEKINNTIELLHEMLECFYLHEQLFVDLYEKYSYTLCCNIFNAKLDVLKDYSKSVNSIFEVNVDEDTIKEVQNSIIKSMEFQL